MGYIAPVNNYQYDQYAERVISKRYNPYHFVPIGKIKPLGNPRENNHHEQPFHLRNTSEGKINQPKRKIQSHEKIYSEMTGVGRLYNEYA